MNLSTSMPSARALENSLEAAPTAHQQRLAECVSRVVRRYLSDLGDTPCQEGLHALILREIEEPLLREVLAWHEGNQSRAAVALGINRTTLRKKLSLYGLA